MDNSTMSPADIAALQNGGIGNEGSWGWLFLILIVLLFRGGGYGAPAPAGNGVTQAELTSGLNNQALQAQLQQIALSSQQNNYETAQLISSQTNSMLQQNNTNLINAIQGFNQVSQQLMGQTNTLGSKIDQLSYHMDQCCCDMKELILNNRLADTQQKLDEANQKLSNANQTQTLLANMGRWVGWSGTGAQTAGVVSTT